MTISIREYQDMAFTSLNVVFSEVSKSFGCKSNSGALRLSPRLYSQGSANFLAQYVARFACTDISTTTESGVFPTPLKIPSN